MIAKYLNRETVLYLVFGVLTTLVGFGLYGLMDWLGFSTVVSNSVSTGLAVTFAFGVNKRFVFASASWQPKTVLREFISFCGGRLGTFLMETGLLVLLVDRMHLPSFLCKCGTSVLVVAGNYFISKFAVFKKQT